jgi:glycerol-3-phosphate dehydrogenase subunit B
MYDVVIIGGGLSGFMAALSLAEKKKKIALISKGDPICCLSTGCIDVLGYGEDPLHEIAKLPKDHPYRLIGQQGVQDSLEYFVRIMNEAGLEYTGDIHANTKILTPLGTAKTTCLVPKSMQDANPETGEYIHVVSFKGLKDFYPSYITSAYKNTGYSVFDAGVSTTLGLATRFEDKSFIEDLAATLKGWEIPDGRIAFPAVLSTSAPEKVISYLSEKLERKIFEIPTIPPSIPGMRLLKALRTALHKKGGNVYWGREIASVEKSGSLVEAVTLESGGRATRVEGKSFILATGSFLGGGLYAQRNSIYETVFNLPVVFPKNRAEWFHENFFDPGHPIEKAGVRVKASFTPYDADIENLFVTGTILASSDIVKQGCGHGLAIATGVAAGRSCEEWLK